MAYLGQAPAYDTSMNAELKGLSLLWNPDSYSAGAYRVLSVYSKCSDSGYVNVKSLAPRIFATGGSRKDPSVVTDDTSRASRWTSA